MVLAGDSLKAMAKSHGRGHHRPRRRAGLPEADVVLLLGDRYEMLSAAVAAAYSGMVVAHIHGGDSPAGGSTSTRATPSPRWATYTSPRQSAAREGIPPDGEDPERVFVVGSPAIDALLRDKPTPRRRLERAYGLPRGEPFLLVVQHPVSTSPTSAAREIGMTLDALAPLGMPMVGVFPNVDPGGERMRKRLLARAARLDMRVFANVPHADYLGLMGACAALVGNSSSGIIEGPTLRVPVVNIGDRQAGRERAENVIDVRGDKASITRAVLRATDPRSRDACPTSRIHTATAMPQSASLRCSKASTWAVPCCARGSMTSEP